MNKNTKFQLKAITVHGDIYDYSQVNYTSVDEKVEIICPIHGLFSQTPRNHLYKRNGCNACAVDRSKLVNTKTIDTFIKEATIKHGARYGYSLVEYVNAITPVKIICSVHGVFEQLPSSHLRGNGCKKCAVRLTTNEFVKKAIERHGTKYQYSNVQYETGKDKVLITCPIHGDFEQRAESHLVGTGCSICALEFKSFQSAAETELQGVISTLGYDTIMNSHSIIPPKEIDIFIPSHNIAIEFDGIFWHSELAHKSADYHLNKTTACSNKGIRLIHIFETEWINNKQLVLSRLKNCLGHSSRIYGRKCSIAVVPTSIAKSFLNENHIQGFCPASVRVGLFYANMLVALMTFAKSRFNREVQWELVRYCNIINHSVVGGASKLFGWFLKKYNPRSIISYSDKRWNTGNLYSNLGFLYSHTSKPNYFYFHQNNTSVILSRQHFQKHKLSRKLARFDPTLTEWENMLNNGYNRIWDCGNDVYIWKTG